MCQAKEAKLKSEAETVAAAKAAFEATFKALAAGSGDNDQKPDPALPSSDEPASPGSDDDAPAPLSPVDPSKCSAAGPGITAGNAGTPTTFTVIAKDRHSWRSTGGGARVVSGDVGAGGGRDVFPGGCGGGQAAGEEGGAAAPPRRGCQLAPRRRTLLPRLPASV